MEMLHTPPPSPLTLTFPSLPLPFTGSGCLWPSEVTSLYCDTGKEDSGDISDLSASCLGVHTPLPAHPSESDPVLPWPKHLYSVSQPTSPQAEAPTTRPQGAGSPPRQGCPPHVTTGPLANLLLTVIDPYCVQKDQEKNEP